ncbi:MAG: alpha/beta hydrolase [Frankiales bacterium]|nr:alpha/beta hydrolase [Frankiales bacterium]
MSLGPDAPEWFAAALARRPEHRDIEVAGTSVHLRSWGDRQLPGVVLVHGGTAHSGWWDHIAPLLADSHRVVALDLSGHGDSGWRERYEVDLWTQEVLAAAAAEIDGPPLVLGHSMGGWVAVAAAVDHGDRLAGAAVIDSPLNDRPPEEERLARRRRPTRVYETLEEGVSRFALLPPQAAVLPYVARHVAEQSLRPVPGGWTWKFDPMFFGSARRPISEMLPDVRARTAFFRCEDGLVPPRMVDTVRGLNPQMPIIELPQSGHHPMLDQPLTLVAALRTLLGLWGPP